MKSLAAAVPVLLLSLIVAAAERQPARRATSAPTQAEMNQAAGDKFEKADAELNRVYAEIRKVYAGDSQFLGKLRESQRLWLKFRDAETEVLYPPHDDEPGYYGSVHPMCVAEYRAKLTLERVQALRAWLVGTEEGDVCSGSIKCRHRPGGVPLSA